MVLEPKSILCFFSFSENTGYNDSQEELNWRKILRCAHLHRQVPGKAAIWTRGQGEMGNVSLLQHRWSLCWFRFWLLSFSRNTDWETQLA